MATDAYTVYRHACLEADLPPLTRREWELEGKLTFDESVQRSCNYAEVTYEWHLDPDFL